jgi:hypothetical protein
VGWALRLVIGRMTVTLIIRQSKDEDGTGHIDIVQPGFAGIQGTEEKRVIPPTKDEKVWSDHKDHIFGHVKGVSLYGDIDPVLIETGYSQWLTLEELSDDDEDEKFLKQGWIEAPQYLESYVESQDRDWTARQVWGFALVEADGKSVKKYVRRVVVRKKNGKEVKRARLVYDYKEPLRK